MRTTVCALVFAALATMIATESNASSVINYSNSDIHDAGNFQISVTPPPNSSFKIDFEFQDIDVNVGISIAYRELYIDPFFGVNDYIEYVTCFTGCTTEVGPGHLTMTLPGPTIRTVEECEAGAIRRCPFFYKGPDIGNGPDVSYTRTGDDAFLKVTISDAIPNSVPEPSAWAMMLVGFGGLGVALRSRRRAAHT